ncbi:hypothetical protein GPECTOR_70g522 [Gonium pectorale]|uniref:Uncharacterized protein n=1 Tax=Gonium pectorale TaxID=33097 RepID=A0A150G3C1_GONPE|nr:hypothetical protein GPECTOR_70g522 [Gonium pectorale]|eukprot:KXZ44291.1 hypothetical protein GPECTOR_70g522 [Gonium pectorale]
MMDGTFKDPLALVTRISAGRNQRLAEEAKRREKNRQNRESLAQAAALEDDPMEEDAEEEPEDAMAAPQVAEEEPEPAATEALCLAPGQPLSPVDLSPLGLDAPSGPEQLELLGRLLASGQLLEYLGAFDAESASPVLQVLFQLVVRGDCPHAAYRQAVQHYEGCEPQEMGWVPQLPDFLDGLQTLGYQLPKAGATGSRKRSSGENAGEGSGAGPSGGGGEAASSAASLANLGCLLRLLADLLHLQQRGRLDLGCGTHNEGTGRQLLTALFRCSLDPHVSSLLQRDIGAAVEGLMGCWDEAHWRRLGHAMAAQVADMGPSHRAAYRLIAGVQGLGERMRGWQAAAAMALLRKEVPQSVRSGNGSGGSRRGSAGDEARSAELFSLLGAKPSVTTAQALLTALKRPRDGGVDFWRVFTILQCVHIVTWHALYDRQPGQEAPDTDSPLARWLRDQFNSVEQLLRRRQNDVAMRLKVFLNVAVNYYESGGMTADH